MNTVYWLRNDLRLHDNECLHRAVQGGGKLAMVYCFDPRHYRMLDVGWRKTGYLRFVFLKESLMVLRKSCQYLGGDLIIRVGQPEEVLPKIVNEINAQRLIYQKEIASEETTVEANLAKALQGSGCELEAVWGKTLYHIDDAPFAPADTPLTSKSFRLKLTKNAEVRPVFEVPDTLPAPPDDIDTGQLPEAAQLGFASEETQIEASGDYPGGEAAALARLQHYTFDTQLLTSYRWTRNRSKGMDYSSKLSPWMALGCLSPRTIYWEVKRYEKEVKRNISTWWLVFEVVWRDYFKFLGLRFGDKMFAEGGIRDRDTDWKYDRELLDRWRWGQTGIPFVDAHMRQLNQTGFMSNRGRVNCASFLTRDYQIDWRWGAAWFETQLLDYDVCSNWLNWNTQATEIYYTNPVHQGMKYDEKGEYVRDWLPELAQVPGPVIQAPWLLNPKEKAQFEVGEYPDPHQIYKKWTRSINRIKKAYEE